MTPPQPEYIITEELLQRGHEVMSKTGRKKYEKEIRSRLYQSDRDIKESVLKDVWTQCIAITRGVSIWEIIEGLRAKYHAEEPRPSKQKEQT